MLPNIIINKISRKFSWFFGVPGEIRTHDPQIRNLPIVAKQYVFCNYLILKMTTTVLLQLQFLKHRKTIYSPICSTVVNPKRTDLDVLVTVPTNALAVLVMFL